MPEDTNDAAVREQQPPPASLTVTFAPVSRFVLGELLLVAMVVSLAAAARATRRVMLPSAEGATACVADAVITIAAIVVLSELLGTVGAFRRIPLAATGITTGALAWALIRRRQPASAARSGAAALPAQPNRAVVWICVAGCVVVAAQWGAWAARQFRTGIIDYDSLNYHLTLAARFVQSGFIAPLHYVTPDSPVQLYPQNSELLHALGMALLGSDLASVFINVGWLMLAIVCGWSIGRRFGLGPVAGLAIAAVMAVPIMADTQAGSAENDAAALTLFLAGLALLMDGGPGLGALCVGGIAAGLAVGSKLTMVAPCVLLGVAVAVTAKRGGRIRALGVWAAGAAVTGSYWYIRNLVMTGSPDPAVSLGIGPLSFTHAPFRLVDQFGFSVAHYWDRPHVWRTILIPGLKALGDAWPALLLVVAVGAAVAVVKRRGSVRVLGAIAAASTAAYVVTPTTAIGFEGRPLLFAENLRYLSPALAAGLVLAALLAAGPRYRRQLAAVCLLGAILVGTLVPGTWPPWPPAYPSANGALSLVAAAAVLVGAWVASLRQRAYRRLAVAGGVCLLLIGAAAVRNRYQDRRYAADPFYSWVEHNVRHARVAVVGFDRQYPLYGGDWSNYVQYVGAVRPHGGFTVAPSCRAWRTALAAGRFSYVAARSELYIEYPSGVPELGWTVSTPGARIVFQGAGAVVIRLTRVPDPAGCPPGSSTRPAPLGRNQSRSYPGA